MEEVLILHVSDVHCADANLARVLEVETYDIAAATGDFECERTAEIFVERARSPAVAVTGNLDHAGVARRLREAGVLLDGRAARIAGLVFGGIGGMDVKTSIETLYRATDRVDVLLSHHPPKGVVDRSFIGLHAGHRAVADAVRRLSPRLHLCGHIHEARGTGRINGTLVVNAGPLKSGYYAVIRLSPDRVSVEHRRLK